MCAAHARKIYPYAQWFLARACAPTLVEMRSLKNLLCSTDHSRLDWRFTPCTFLVRLWEKDTDMAWRLGRFPVKSQIRARIDMPSRTGARAACAAGADCTLPKKDDVGAKALAERRLAMAARAERRRTIMGKLRNTNRGREESFRR